MQKRCIRQAKRVRASLDPAEPMLFKTFDVVFLRLDKQDIPEKKIQVRHHVKWQEDDTKENLTRLLLDGPGEGRTDPQGFFKLAATVRRSKSIGPHYQPCKGCNDNHPFDLWLELTSYADNE